MTRFKIVVVFLLVSAKLYTATKFTAQEVNDRVNSVIFDFFPEKHRSLTHDEKFLLRCSILLWFSYLETWSLFVKTAD